MFVNFGYVKVNVSLAETLRSAEPVFSIVLALFFLKEEPVTLLMFISLFPIVIGGVLSSLSDATFSLEGLVFVTISNISFSLRSLLTKHTRKVFPTDAFNLFYQISRAGLLILLVTLAMYEICWGMFVPKIASKEKIGIKFVIKNFDLVMLNGFAYALYNQMSFYILSKVEMVTHAVANAIRRTVTILSSIWYFQHEVTFMNRLGIISSFFGVMLYAKAKGAFSSRKGKSSGV